MEADNCARMICECRGEMYAIAFAMLRNASDAEDAVSMAVLRAYERRDSLQEESRFRSWIMAILVNEVKLLIRKNHKMVVTDIQMAENTATVLDGHSELWELVCLLQPDLRDVVILHYYKGYTTKEVAGILHIPVGTVLSRLSRARKKLRKMI